MTKTITKQEMLNERLFMQVRRAILNYTPTNQYLIGIIRGISDTMIAMNLWTKRQEIEWYEMFSMLQNSDITKEQYLRSVRQFLEI